jgi:geranylgeranyl diphosphate synthase type I
MAFQYQDDLLGVWGDERQTGKSAAADVRNGKKGLPAVLAFRLADPPRRAALERLYALPERDADAARQVLDIFEAVGARERATALVDGRFSEARERLEAAPGAGRGKDRLCELVESLRVRAS